MVQQGFGNSIVNIVIDAKPFTLSGKMSRIDLDMNDNEPEEALPVNSLTDNDDIALLKARFKKRSSNEEEDGFLPQFSDNKCSVIHTSELTESSSGHSDVSSKSESLFQSTETLIDNLDVPHCHSSECIENDPVGNKLKMPDKGRPNLSGSEAVLLKSNSQNDVEQVTASIQSGLLISPSSLTQDVPVEMGSDNKRISSVLESLDLQLVYIPATHQLVTAKPQESFTNGSNESADNSCGTSPYERSRDTETAKFDSGLSSDYKSDSSLSTPTKMATDTISLHSVTILSPASLDDSSSICETDCLIKIKEPDQLTCDSSEFECNFPRINTNDSLLRTFTDASSLSSLSTGTDFSVSAASLDDGETGMCIDTGDGGFMEINLHSRNSYERAKNPSQDSGFEDRSVKPKRKGLSAFLSR